MVWQHGRRLDIEDAGGLAPLCAEHAPLSGVDRVGSDEAMEREGASGFDQSPSLDTSKVASDGDVTRNQKTTTTLRPRPDKAQGEEATPVALPARPAGKP